MNDKPRSPLLRPRDLALLMLASRDLRPRQRARDQQADLAGLALKRRILEVLTALDPEPTALEAALLQITQDIGPPFGPTRAVAGMVMEEWRNACLCPDWVAQLLAEAVEDRRSAAREGNLG